MTVLSTEDAHAAQDHAHDHPAFLAHHFDTPEQQFEAGKLGMWLFLATELLLFGGLFCAYAVARHNHPELFEYGSQFLNTTLGATNTVVLILSSLTMASAVYAAQLGRKRTLITLLAITFLGGAVFMGIKYIEYSHKFHDNLVWGVRFYQEPEHMAAAAHEEQPAGAQREHGDAVHGKELFLGTCRACHGVAGEGIPGQGKNQRGSPFIASKTDRELVAFIKVGRMPFDPLNTTGIQMPPKGGNPLLTDDELLDIVAYIRTFPAPAEGETAAAAAAADAATEFFIPRSSIPPAPAGPPGMTLADPNPPPAPSAETVALHHTEDPHRPPNAHIFFGIYFCMTGLHGIHVLAGMAMMVWLIILTARGKFSAEYYTPVDLGGLYWHVVDLIWIFLFPLFYLIR